MVLERQFSGPLQDMVIQRLRDRIDGTVCYLYLPISAPHSPTTASGFVQYGRTGSALYPACRAQLGPRRRRVRKKSVRFGRNHRPLRALHPVSCAYDEQIIRRLKACLMRLPF
jgi:hypothetical protein